MIEPDTVTKIEQLPGRIVSEIKTRYYDAHEMILGRYYEPSNVTVYTACYGLIVAGVVGTFTSGLSSGWPLSTAFGLGSLSLSLYTMMKFERRWSDTSDDPAVEIEQEADGDQEPAHAQ